MADFVSSTENDKIIGTDGDDHITLQGLRTVGDGGAGNDNILSSGYLSTLKGGAGDDLVELMSSYIVASGDAGNDTLIAEATGRFVNIANVSMTGGEGADTFVLMPTYAKTVDADGNDVYNWKTVLSSNIMDFNIADGDQIILQNVGEGDYDEEADRVDPNTYNLYYGRDTNRDLRFYDYNGRVNFTFKGITRLSDVANAEIYYIDQSGIPLGGQYLSNAVPFATLSSGVRTLNNWLILSGADGGDLWLNDTSYSVIDAVEDSVAGRALVGNERDNWIYAGDYGSKMWGRSGANYLVGGAGADTFFASQDESTVYIVNCGDDDIVKFQDITLEDLAGLSFDTSEGYGADGFGAYENLNITTKGGTLIQVARPDDAKTFTVQLADALTFRFNYDDQSWDFADRESIAPLEEPEITAGLMTFGNTVFVTSSYEGDFRLSSLDDDSIANISAVNDTVSGRKLIGDALSNVIRAGSGGASLYGNGGFDTLFGGAGADTFVAGKNENAVRIYDYQSKDVVYLRNIKFSDIEALGNNADTMTRVLDVVTKDTSTLIQVRSAVNVESTNFVLGDGSTLRYALEDDEWQRKTSSTGDWQTLTNINGNPLGLWTYNDTAYLFGDADGYFSLAELNNDSIKNINATSNNVEGMILVGDAQNNNIYANDYGSSMYGGAGTDYLIGGAGNDTFRAGMSEGDIHILQCAADDVVDLWNIDFADIKYLFNSSDGESRFTYVQTNDDSQIIVEFGAGDTTTTTFALADDSTIRFNAADNIWQRNTSGAWQTIDEVNGMPVGVQLNNNLARVFGDYDGDFSLASLNKSSIAHINAELDYTAGRVLIGDAQSNMIYANNYGSSIYGGAGDDTFYGGAGADTFRAGRGEGTAYIMNVESDDLIQLHNANFSDLLSLYTIKDDDVRAVYLDMNDGSNVAATSTIDSVTIAFELADGSTLRFDDADGIWQRNVSGSWQTITEVNGRAFGLQLGEGIAYVFPDYDGDFSLAALNDSSIVSVTAYYDDLNGRKLIGDAQSNRLRASNYAGSWLWGGTDGNDILVGGAGADTFQAGQGEGNDYIMDYENGDVVYLHNVNYSDLNSLFTLNDESGRTVYVYTNDGSNVAVGSTADGVMTTFELADGSTIRHDSTENAWQRNVSGNWQTITEVNDVSVGLQLGAGIAYVFSDYDGDFSLAALNDSSFVSLSGYYDDLNGRKLFGNDQSNRVRASATAGSWIWGGSDGDDTLVGGAGADTFQAGAGEGSAYIMDYESADLIYLHNINVEDVATLSASTVEGGKMFYVETSDGSGVTAIASTEEETINYQFADGSGLRYDAVDNQWQRKTSPSKGWQTITEINGSTVGTLDESNSAPLDSLNDLWGGNSVDDTFIDGGDDLRAEVDDDLTSIMPSTDNVALKDIEGIELISNAGGGASLITKYAAFRQRKNS